MEPVLVCPICSARHFEPVMECDDPITHRTFALQKCSQCDLVFTSPRPAAEALAEYYQSEKYLPHAARKGGLRNLVYRAARSINLRWKLSLISRYSPAGTLLDVGCGTGEFLKAALDAGWSGLGLETDPIAAGHAHALSGVQIFQRMEEVPRPSRAITLWHVLEHVPHPEETLRLLRERIDGDGTLFVAVPNLASEDAKHYGRYWAGYDVPRHFWHFRSVVMEKLMAGQRFQLIQKVPMRLDAYYVSLLSEKNLGTPGVLRIPLAMRVAARSNARARTTGEYSSVVYIAKPC